MSADLTHVNAAFDGLIQKLNPTRRRQLARDISKSLRASQAQRIKRNTAPTGQPYEPRKPQLKQRRGAIKRRLMFQKLIRAKWLKATSTANAATVGFVGFANQVAREHHYGLRSRLSEHQSVQMPKRELLGLTDAEYQQIEDITLRYLAL